MIPLVEVLGIVAVLLGVALAWFARFRFITNEPEESPFAGSRWRAFPPPRAFRSPGFPIFLCGEAAAIAGAILILVRLFR